MKGLDLAEAYYQTHGASMIKRTAMAYTDRIAVGLVGAGSECFGFDDEISRDHDWGPGFCMWLTAEDYVNIGTILQEAYEKLPSTFKGFGPRSASPGEEGRVGVSEIKAFYRTYTGLDHAPADLGEWLFIPEQSLALCTNGKIFADPLGIFSQWRETLISFYPEDVRLKKISSRCMTIAQAGQYNFVRSLRRKELFAAHYAEAQFCADVISLVFLLNRRYTPFYKWMHRAVKELPLLGEKIHTMIADLIARTDYDEKRLVIEEVCSILIKELINEGLSDLTSDFLLDHAHCIHEKIQEKGLRERFSVIT